MLCINFTWGYALHLEKVEIIHCYTGTNWLVTKMTVRFQRITWAVNTRWGLVVLKWKDISNEYTLEKLENQIMSGSSIAVVFVHSTWSEYQLTSSFICTSSSRVIEYKKSVKWQPPDDCRVCTWMIIISQRLLSVCIPIFLHLLMFSRE